MAFIRRVKTASGATAVQIVEKRGGVRRILEHIGSGHDEQELAVLMARAHQRLNLGQQTLDLGLEPSGDEKPWQPSYSQTPQVVSTSSLLLWQVLADAYHLLGFDALGDEAFKAMVLARIIEPASKADTVRILAEVGAPAPHVNTLHTALARCVERDYRAKLATACLAYSAQTTGKAALIMYDVTTLHFANDDEDSLRRVGMSKEHRIAPQVQVGLLVDPGGFPLEVHLFEGNRAETTTIVPVLNAFQARHGVSDLVVVADAGMLSAGNLNALEDAGFSFIVGSRMTKAPYDLAEHFTSYGDHFDDGQILESTRTMGTGRHGRDRRILYQYSFKRGQRDNRNINKMIERAERIASGKAPMKRARFVKVTGASVGLNQPTIDRARQLAGLKGYVTNLSPKTMPAKTVIGAYHDLWHVEASFRMTKSDLRARPIFHHRRESIEAHLTVVFAALAMTRHLTAITGVSIKKLLHTLRPLHSATIKIGSHEIVAAPVITAQAREILDCLPPVTLPGH